MTVLILLYQTLLLIVALYTATSLIGDEPNDNLITLRRFKKIWNSRNKFGRVQIIIVVILFLPGVIGGFVFNLILVAIAYIVVKFVDLGRKK